MNSIIIAAIVAVTVIACVAIIVRGLNKHFLSRTHLHSFNRRSEQLLVSQKQEYQQTLASMKQEIDGVRSRVDALSMR